MGKIKVLSLCDGIAGGLMAFEKVFEDTESIEYHAIEKNKNSRDLADFNYPNIKRWDHDVTTVNFTDILNHGPFDWVIMGPVCKSVSPASNGDGLKGSSSILFDCIKIRDWVLKLNPKAKYIVENVKMKNAFYKQYCKVIGHNGYMINSSLVSGQERLRYYWTNFKLHQPQDRKIMLNDVLEDGLIGKAWSKSSRYKDKNGKVYSSPGPGRKYYKEERYKKQNKANTLLATKYCKGQSTETRVFYSRNKYRYLTIRECARLQTIPESFNFDYASESHAYKTIGDGWNIDTIAHIIKCGLENEESNSNIN